MINLSSVTTVIHLAATNDSSGNPRRAYVAFSGSALRGAWSEGYSGTSAVPREIRDLAANAPRIAVSPAELKSWLKAAAALDPALCN
jgi:hypothetical protein